MIKPYVETFLSKESYEYNIHRTGGLAYAVYMLDFKKYFGHIVPFHWHNEFEISFLIRGKLKVTVERKEIILEPGKAIFINSNCFHSYSDISKEGSKFFAIAFSGSFVTENSASNPLYTKYIKPLSKNKNIPFIVFSPTTDWQNSCINKIKLIYMFEKEERYFYEFSIRNTLSEIFCEILIKNVPKEIPEEKMEILITKMLDYINENYSKNITVKNISASANISVRECYRKFNEKLSSTPIGYLDSVRMKKAIAFLEETDMNITEICYEIGFSSSSYFSSKFKKTIGCSPKEYRKLHNIK